MRSDKVDIWLGTYVKLLNAVVMEMSSNYDEKNDEVIAMNRRDRNIQDLTKSSGPDESEGHQRVHPLPSLGRKA